VARSSDATQEQLPVSETELLLSELAPDIDGESVPRVEFSCTVMLDAGGKQNELNASGTKANSGISVPRVEFSCTVMLDAGGKQNELNASGTKANSGISEPTLTAPELASTLAVLSAPKMNCGADAVARAACTLSVQCVDWMRTPPLNSAGPCPRCRSRRR